MSIPARLGLAGSIAGLIVTAVVAVGLTGRGGAQPPPAPAAGAAASEATHAHSAPASPRPAGAKAAHGHPGTAGGDAVKRVGSSRARRLIVRTRAAARQWSDVADARADGFRSIGDGVTGHEHYVNWSWADDPDVLVPSRPESLVYEVSGARRTLVSAMYILPPGSTMRDVPDLGDERAQWHRHTNLCWQGRRVVGLHFDGRCVPDGIRRNTTPMLHVWLASQRCGPFAGLGVHGDHCVSD